MKPEFIIIGGTGIGSRLAELPGPSIAVPTREGMVHGKVVQFAGKPVMVMQRHSAGHKTPPHRVNYKSFALCAKSLKVKGVFASAAVGSLVKEWGPGTLVACDDFLDDSSRQQTLFDREVIHRDFTHPFDPSLRKALIDSAAKLGLDCQPQGTYLTGNGPRYETPAEIKMYASWGANLVGMTASTEAVLMREALVPYACLAVVTNLAAGMSEGELNHGEVVDVMETRGPDVLRLFESAIAQL